MGWLADFRFALRSIRKNPWFSLAIAATLALGIGVNTTVFSLVNAVLSKPLPFPGGERLAMVRATNPARGDDSLSVSYPDFLDFRAGDRSFERLEAFGGMPVTLAESGTPAERYRGARVSAGMFEMLRMSPVLGRGFAASDATAGAPLVVLLGHGVWVDRYGKDPNVVGRAVRVNGQPATIAGVMPRGFKFPNNEDLWIPLIPSADLEKRDARSFALIGMRREGVSVYEAQAGLAVIAARLATDYPASHRNHGVIVQTFHDAMNGGRIRVAFFLMLGAVGFVLLIACANVANMMLSKALVRRREMSIRAALGASRWRMIRQLLVESVLLSLLGGLLGLAFAQFGVRWFDAAVADVGKPYWIDFSIDYRVLAYFAAVCVLSGILFGLAPAWRSSRVDLHDALKDGTRTIGGGRGGRLSGALVVFQFALAVVLLSGAGLMLRSFFNAQREFSGVPAARILHARLSLPAPRYPDPEKRFEFYEKLRADLTAAPGVESVALTSNPPGQGFSGWRFELRERPIAEAEQRPRSAAVVVSPGYFSLLGMRVTQGRDFEDADGLPGRESAIVGQSLASRFFPRESALGKQFRLFDNNVPKPWMTIVGVVPDIRQDNADSTVERSSVFVPYRSERREGMTVLIRSSGPASIQSAALRQATGSLDSEVPVFELQPLDEAFRRSYWHLRVFGTVFFAFAAIALGMAAVGVYAVMAHATAQRRREIGLRMALGARVPDILRLVLARGIGQLLAGAAIGLAVAFAVCRLMAGLLFQTSANDPVAFGGVALTLVAVGTLACWIPARRAAQIEPLEAIRHE